MDEMRLWVQEGDVHREQAAWGHKLTIRYREIWKIKFFWELIHVTN